MTKENKQNIALSTLQAITDFNNTHNTGWNLGSNWSSVNTQFETFIEKFLFPKISATDILNVDLGNRFDWLAKEVDFISQYSEEYVVMDSIPIAMNLSKQAELMLQRNRPTIATKLYQEGIVKKQKFTLNNNDNRLNFLTLNDGVKYALAVYRKKISDINVLEEKEIKAMLIDYSLNVTNDVREVSSLDDLFNECFNALLNLQNNSEKYNECNKASNGAVGRYTTQTDLESVAILTNDKVKTALLNSHIANTFQVQGIDLSSKIISFDDLGGTFRVNEDITISDDNTISSFRAYGDYQVEKGDIVPEGNVFTFDISELKEFKGKVEEIKPKEELFAYIFDINKIRYKRFTKDMLKEPFYNGEYDETNYWIHYYSSKSMSPFYNNIRIGK